MQNNIREIMDEKNLKIIDILEHTKLSKSYLYDVINGLSVPTLTVARKIADALGTTVEKVF